MQNIIRIRRLTLPLQEPTGNWQREGNGNERSMDEIEALRFYNGTAWKKKRAEVLRLDNNECVICKSRGKYSKAVIVHHVKHLRDCPELGLEIYDNGKRQLVSLCKSCHEEQHPEAFMQNAMQFIEPLTEERWD